MLPWQEGAVGCTGAFLFQEEKGHVDGNQDEGACGEGLSGELGEVDAGRGDRDLGARLIHMRQHHRDPG